MTNYLRSINAFGPFYEGADYSDVKSVAASMDLRHFVAGFLFHHPKWLAMLYKVRAIFVRLLGMRQKTVDMTPVRPQDISFTPGDRCEAFTIVCGKDNEYLGLEIDDKHLKAHLLLAAEPIANGQNRFHIGTIVHHKHWTGPVYFTLIRPFHTLIINRMTAAALKNYSTGTMS